MDDQACSFRGQRTLFSRRAARPHAVTPQRRVESFVTGGVCPAAEPHLPLGAPVCLPGIGLILRHGVAAQAVVAVAPFVGLGNTPMGQPPATPNETTELRHRGLRSAAAHRSGAVQDEVGPIAASNDGRTVVLRAAQEGNEAMGRIRSLFVVATFVGVGLAVGAPAAAAPPSNDTVAGATPIGGLPFFDEVDTSEATTDQAELDAIAPCAGVPAVERAVWYVAQVTTDARCSTDRCVGQ